MLRWVAIVLLGLLVCGGALTLASYAGFEWWRVSQTGEPGGLTVAPEAAAPSEGSAGVTAGGGGGGSSDAALSTACVAGSTAFAARNNDEALTQLDLCLEAHPGDVDARLLRGRAYAALGRYDLAQLDLEKALLDRPGDEPGWEALAYSRIRTENDRGAITALDTWIALNPNAAAAWRMRADARFRLGNPTAAMIDAERSCTLGDVDGCTLETRLKEARKRR